MDCSEGLRGRIDGDQLHVLLVRFPVPISYSNPGIRLSLSPDGKSILYPSIRRTSSLWMMEGFDRPGWVDQLREMLPW